MRRIGIITGGGDCAGLNAVIVAIVKTGQPLGYEFLGFERGWEGVLDPLLYRSLDRDNIRGISHLGGTVLRTTNHGRFAAKVGAGDKNAIDPDILAMAKRNLDHLGVEGLIVLGGDGTLSGALQLADLGINLVGVPKTIDNDLAATDKTFGFSTAVQIAVDALDKIHTTASSHDRTFFIECMGRHAGWISLYAGFAAGADAIVLPEFDFDVEHFLGYLRSRQADRRRSNIVVVAEGARLGGQEFSHRSSVTSSETVFGGVSEHLIRTVDSLAPGEFEMRNVVLGHTQRGGSPTSQDRILAKRYGVQAMLAYDAGEFNVMIASRDNVMETVPIAEAVGGLKLVTRETYEYQAAKRLGIYLNG
ncbi:MAG: ATP-dependent 6-phosphofructokinase [Actinomycetota bacterium]|nr:ATP-dependent 6-phosphofructokinase [Actinomycetota bacterium]